MTDQESDTASLSIFSLAFPGITEVLPKDEEERRLAMVRNIEKAWEKEPPAKTIFDIE
jgi:hypothetical protein